MSCLALSITITALVGAGLAPTPALATLPLSLQFIATAAMTIPASLLMGRFGRRAGFTFGGLLGMAGGAISCVAVFLGDFWLFCLGGAFRSEEHTSELQSLMRISYAVFCLKKKKI